MAIANIPAAIDFNPRIPLLAVRGMRRQSRWCRRGSAACYQKDADE